MEKRVTRWMLVLIVGVVVIRVAGASGIEPLVVAPVLSTPPLYNYDDARRDQPDAGHSVHRQR